MTVDVEVPVNAPKERVWRIISDIENADRTISGIESIEVLEKPNESILGLKWKETRKMFGQTATETMTVTDLEDGTAYVTEAASHGSHYRSRVWVVDDGAGSRVGMSFSGRPTSTLTRILYLPMGLLMKSATRKALLKDLQEIRAAAEAGS